MVEPQRSIEDFFDGKSDEMHLFRLVQQCIESLGDVRIVPGKSQIAFSTKTQFAWVWFPPLWAKNRPEKSIVLSFGVGRRIEDEGIVQSVEPYPGRWMHHMILRQEADVSQDVCAWLAEAYAFAESRKSRKGSRS